MSGQPVSRVQTLHLYRHILRESSYLPPAFSHVIINTIIKRFHGHQKLGPLSKQNIKQAATALRTIRAANHGSPKAMAKLINTGFGRGGFRRRELMAKFVKPEGPANSKALEDKLSEPKTDSITKTANEATDISTDKLVHEPTADNPIHETPDQSIESKPTDTKKPKVKNAFLDKWDTPKLTRMLASQKTQQGQTKVTTSWPGTAVKGGNPADDVPKLTVWGQPPKERAVRTKMAKWWKRNADKILPPLGAGEWDLLKRLSEGAQEGSEWSIPLRRIPATSSHTDNDSPSQELTWKDYASLPASTVERPKSMGVFRRTGQIDQGPYAPQGKLDGLSARWFRRMYNRTWQITSTMEQHPNTLEYRFKWGSAPPRIVEPTPRQSSIFDGVDTKGQPLTTKKDQSQ